MKDDKKSNFGSDKNDSEEKVDETKFDGRSSYEATGVIFDKAKGKRIEIGEDVTHLGKEKVERLLSMGVVKKS